MIELRIWTYYRFASITGAHPTRYYRYWCGITDRLEPKARAWVSVDPDYLTRYIALGKVGLDEVTRHDVQAAVGLPLPD